MSSGGRDRRTRRARLFGGRMRFLNVVRAALIGALGVLASWNGIEAATPEVTQWADTYNGNDIEANFPWHALPGCTSSRGLVGYEPALPGKYPVLVFIGGAFSYYRSAGIAA